jgi:Rrf2 family protein
MLFSASCQYALRALVHMATEPRGHSFRAGDISDAEGIPPGFLFKVLRELVRTGLVRSRRGPGGGYTLIRPAAEIRVREIIDSIDKSRNISSICVLGLGHCNNSDPCELHAVWRGYRDSFLDSLSRLTLEDMAETLLAKRNATGKLDHFTGT